MQYAASMPEVLAPAHMCAGVAIPRTDSTFTAQQAGESALQGCIMLRYSYGQMTQMRSARHTLQKHSLHGYVRNWRRSHRRG